MLFSKETYTGRRASLRERVGDGLILIMGNNILLVFNKKSCSMAKNYLINRLTDIT